MCYMLVDLVIVVIVVTGVCKIQGVVIVVNCCYSMGFSTTHNNKNTVYFASTGIVIVDIVAIVIVIFVIVIVVIVVVMTVSRLLVC